MLFTIVKKEIFESIFSLRFPLFLLVGIVLIPMGLYVNEVNYNKRLSDYNEQVRLQDRALSSSQMWDVLSGTVPLKGFLQPSPLSAFAEGLQSVLPRFYEFRRDGYKQGEVPSGEKSLLTEAGEMDFAFIVQMVISLIVLMFGADVISGEKELGTLRGILSNSIPRDTVLLGKLIGGYVALWVPFAIAFLFGILVIGLTSFPLGNPEILTRIALVFLMSSVFIFIYFSIGVMVSTTTSKTRTSLVAILVVWTFFQLIIPKSSTMIANLVYPIRTETVVSMQKSLAVNAIEKEKAGVLGKKYQEIFGNALPYSLQETSPQRATEWYEFRHQIEQKYTLDEAEQVNAIDESYRREKNTQENIESAVSLLSPGAVFNRVVTDLCGTGECTRSKYIDAVKAHQVVLDQQLFGLVKQTPLILSGQGTGTSVSVERLVDLKSLPSFSVQEAGLGEICLRNTNGFISLAFWLVVPFAIAYMRFRRYDVR